MNLLEIQASVREANSISRQLSGAFIQAWRSPQPGVAYQLRDVGLRPPAHPTELWTTANYLSPEARSPEMVQALAESEGLIEELCWADRLVLGVPMYNFSVPSTLKAYLDNVIRINRTFSFDRETQHFRGLAPVGKALVITPSAGNFVVGTPLDGLNFCDTYLRSVLGFIGIEDVTVVTVPDQFMEETVRQQARQTACEQLQQLAMDW
ncbi:NAD(P)H-dependent oxidoreductase [filamentous cyanobacterium LEGE 11480]|uniref:FMN dependent NADH:quinone oxidoreductase n=1 Tax=Romeriopsis navalis LEGE 11480 TaxID=2777977 RepID=A0A928Z2R9_9CYAN|nr:NAD(P)H-dependent oxidoreductase [Romeriopsis navalis]MBE9029342.1 NAD(P)H-dependent oxidoreductase [Romeriopsis navalis LEGE 11480]